MKKFKYPWEEKGRSMVEMLGVLAVIGVLTVTGIVGMQYAMQIHKENETLNVFSVATAGARTANLMQNYIYSCDGHYPCTVKPKSVISTKYDMRDTDFSTAVGSPMMVRIEDTDGYTVRIRGISKEVCESIKSGYWGETCAGVDDAGTTKYRTANCKSLKELDCSQFENANSGLIRRSALQEEISKNLKEPTVNYAQAGYSALVLYYNDKAFADTDTFIGEENENYPDPDDTDSEGSNPSYSSSDPTPLETTSSPYTPMPPTTTSTTLLPTTTTLKPTRPPHSVPVSTTTTTLTTQAPTSLHTRLTTPSRITVQASTTTQTTVLPTTLAPTTTLKPTRPPQTVPVSTATTTLTTQAPIRLSTLTSPLVASTPPHTSPEQPTTVPPTTKTTTVLPTTTTILAPTTTTLPTTKMTSTTTTTLPTTTTSTIQTNPVETARNGSVNGGFYWRYNPDDPNDPNAKEDPNGEDPRNDFWYLYLPDEYKDDPDVLRCSWNYAGRLQGPYHDSSLEEWRWDEECCALVNGQMNNGVCCIPDKGMAMGWHTSAGTDDSYPCCNGENSVNGMPARRCCNRYENKEFHSVSGGRGLCCDKGTWDPETKTCNTTTSITTNITTNVTTTCGRGDCGTTTPVSTTTPLTTTETTEPSIPTPPTTTLKPTRPPHSVPVSTATTTLTTQAPTSLSTARTSVSVVSTPSHTSPEQPTTAPPTTSTTTTTTTQPQTVPTATTRETVSLTTLTTSSVPSSPHTKFTTPSRTTLHASTTAHASKTVGMPNTETTTIQTDPVETTWEPEPSIIVTTR